MTGNPHISGGLLAGDIVEFEARGGRMYSPPLEMPRCSEIRAKKLLRQGKRWSCSSIRSQAVKVRA